MIVSHDSATTSTTRPTLDTPLIEPSPLIKKIHWYVTVTLTFPVLIVATAGVYYTRELGERFTIYKICYTLLAGYFIQSFLSVALPERARVVLHRTCTQLLYPIEMVFWNVYYRINKLLEEKQWAGDSLLGVAVMFTTCLFRDLYDSFFVEGRRQLSHPTVDIPQTTQGGPASPNNPPPQYESFFSRQNLGNLCKDLLVAGAGGGIMLGSRYDTSKDAAYALEMVGYELASLGSGYLFRDVLHIFKKNAAIADDAVPLTANRELSRQTKIFGRLDATVNHYLVPLAAIFFAAAVKTNLLYLISVQGTLTGYRIKSAELQLLDPRPNNDVYQDSVEQGEPSRTRRFSRIACCCRCVTIGNVVAALFAIVLPAYFGIEAYQTCRSQDPKVTVVDKALVVAIACTVPLIYNLAFLATKLIQRAEDRGDRHWAMRQLRLHFLECNDLLGYSLATADVIAKLENMPYPLFWPMLAWCFSATVLAVQIANIDRTPQNKEEVGKLNPIASIFGIILEKDLSKVVKP